MGIVKNRSSELVTLAVESPYITAIHRLTQIAANNHITEFSPPIAH